MTESEVRKLLRQMKELDSQTAFRDFYNMTYDRLFRIAYYYVKQEEWSQEIVRHHPFRFLAGATGTKLFSGRVINQ